MTSELPSTGTGSAARWRAGHLAVLVVVVVLGLWLGWQERDSGGVGQLGQSARESRWLDVSWGDDEAIYVALSQSLGQGRYRDEYLAGTPPHSKYPPGNPAWLLLVRSLGGPDLDLARFANLLLLAIAAVLTGDAVRRLTSPWAGVGAAAVVLLNPELLLVSGTLLSEAPYVALVAGSAWACLRGQDPAGRRWELVGFAAALAAFLTRSIGLAALGAITVTYFVRRRWLAGALAGAGSALTAGGWTAYTSWAGRQASTENYVAEVAARAEHLSYLPKELVAGIMFRGLKYLRSLPSRFALPTIEGTPVDNLVWYVLLFGLAGVGLWVLARRWPMLALTIAGSFLLLLTWVWSLSRLILPLLPGIVVLLMVGAHTLGSRRGARGALLAVSALAVLLCGSALVRHWSWVAKARACNPMPQNGPAACYGDRDVRLVAAAKLAGRTLPNDAIIAASKPATVFHFSHRATIFTGTLVSRTRRDPTRTLGSFGFTHIVLGEVLTDWSVVAPVLQRHCGALRVVADFPPATVLLRLDEAGAPDDRACRYLESRIRPEH